VVLAIVGGCAAPRAAAPAFDEDLAAPRTVERAYTLAWHGARIGDAVERETWRADGVRLVRRERLRVTRGGAPSATDVEIAIDADRALVASRVEWRELRTDGAPASALAIRDARGWRIDITGEPPRTAPGDAVPEELLPLIVRRDGAFRGPVLLTGRGFALAHADVIARGPRALRATVTTDAGASTADVTIDGAGDPLAIVGSDGVVMRRADAAELDAAFDPPEVVDGAAIALDRAPPADPFTPITIELHGATRAPPTGLTSWRIELSPTRATDSVAPLRTLAQDVFASEPGDCTAHALAFAARARAAGIATRVVTGWRVDGARLVRHRWVMAELEDATWVAVDPSYGEAPAAPRLIALTESDTSLAGLALADLAYAGTECATASLR
jgi:hypothetical protein